MIIGESAIVRRWEKTMFLWAIFWKIKFREARLLHGQFPPTDGPNRLLIITVAVRRIVFPPNEPLWGRSSSCFDVCDIPQLLP